jgi:hypothetical protein
MALVEHKDKDQAAGVSYILLASEGVHDNEAKINPLSSVGRPTGPPMFQRPRSQKFLGIENVKNMLFLP